LIYLSIVPEFVFLFFEGLKKFFLKMEFRRILTYLDQLDYNTLPSYQVFFSFLKVLGPHYKIHS